MAIRQPSLARRTLAALGTLFGVSAVTAGLGEITLRAILGIRPLAEAREIYEAHPRWGWRMKPGGEGDFVKLGARQHVRINALGLRDVERQSGKPPDTWRILALGDSAVAGLEVPIDRTWTQRTEALLRERGRRVEVWNAGVRGWGTDQSLLYLLDEGRRWAPDVVLYFWNDNDVDDNETVHRPFREYGKAWFDIAPDGSLVLKGAPVPDYAYAQSLRVGPNGEAVELAVPASAKASLWLRDAVVMRSAFGTALAHALVAVPQLTQVVTRAGTYGDFRNGKPGFEREGRAFRVSRAMVAEMRRTSEASDAKFRMLYADEGWGASLREDLGMPALGDVPAFRRHLPKGARYLVPFDSHWNELGHDSYARALADVLEANGLAGPPAPGAEPKS